MFGQPGYNMPYGYPMSTAQQRLAQMEAQYPQFTPVNVNTYPPTPNGPLAASQGPQAGYIRGRVVTSIDEVKGAMIDLDGGVHVFTDFGNHKIYTKQINLDGTATINTYTLDNPTPGEMTPPVNRAEFEQVVQALGQKVESLENQLKEVMGNVQPNANDGNVQRKK